jgi:hypothetical protein
MKLNKIQFKQITPRQFEAIGFDEEDIDLENLTVYCKGNLWVVADVGVAYGTAVYVFNMDGSEVHSQHRFECDSEKQVAEMAHRAAAVLQDKGNLPKFLQEWNFVQDI